MLRPRLKPLLKIPIPEIWRYIELEPADDLRFLVVWSED